MAVRFFSTFQHYYGPQPNPRKASPLLLSRYLSFSAICVTGDYPQVLFRQKWRGKRRIIEQEGRSGLSVSFSIFKPMPRIAGLSKLFSQAAHFLYFLMPMCPREVFHIRKEFLKTNKEAPGGFLIQTPKSITVLWKNEMNFGSFWTLSLSHRVPWTGRGSFFHVSFFLPCEEESTSPACKLSDH